jgi:hypothetical protein
MSMPIDQLDCLESKTESSEAEILILLFYLLANKIETSVETPPIAVAAVDLPVQKN